MHSITHSATSATPYRPEEKSPIEQLPLDLLTKIFSNLPRADLHSCSAVNHSFRHCITTAEYANSIGLQKMDLLVRDGRTITWENLTDLLAILGYRDFNNSDLSNYLKKIEHLDLSNLNIDNVQLHALLQHCPKLISLRLCDCPCVASLKALFSLTNLTTLHLRDCPLITSLKELSGLTNLRNLFLWNCPLVTSLEPLSGMTNLTNLHLEHCPRVTSLKPLSDMTNLRNLFLQNCPRITSLEALSGLPNLTISRR